MSQPDEYYRSLELTGGNDCDQPKPDLLVYGGARITKTLCVKGDIKVSGTIIGGGGGAAPVSISLRYTTGGETGGPTDDPPPTPGFSQDGGPNDDYGPFEGYFSYFSSGNHREVSVQMRNHTFEQNNYRMFIDLAQLGISDVGVEGVIFRNVWTTDTEYVIDPNNDPFHLEGPIRAEFDSPGVIMITMSFHPAIGGIPLDMEGSIFLSWTEVAP